MTKNMSAVLKAKIVKPKDPIRDMARKHEAAVLKREKLRAQHLATFDLDRKLEAEINDLETELKPIIRPLYEGQPTAKHTAYRGETTTIYAQTKWQTSVEADALIAAMPELRNVPGLFVTRLNPSMLAILIKDGTVPAGLASAHMEAKQTTTAITFDRTEADDVAKVSRVVEAFAPLATVTRLR